MQLLHFYKNPVPVEEAAQRLVWNDRRLPILSRFHHIYGISAA
jgi:hypothetical protein